MTSLEVAENQRWTIDGRDRQWYSGTHKEETMTTRKILKAFGFELWRSYGRWFACRPGEGPAFATYSADRICDLVEQIVPEPPSLLTASAIKAWGEECRAASYRPDIDPKDLAKAAFAAYAIDPPDEFIECFISAWDDPQR